LHVSLLEKRPKKIEKIVAPRNLLTYCFVVAIDWPVTRRAMGEYGMKLTLKHSDGSELEVNSVREAIQATSTRYGVAIAAAISNRLMDATLYLRDAKQIPDWQVYATLTGLDTNQSESFIEYILLNPQVG